MIYMSNEDFYNNYNNTYKYNIFIAHQIADSYQAESVARQLAENDMRVYCDTFDNHLLGDGIRLEIYLDHVVKNSDVVVVMLESKSNQSWWVTYLMNAAREGMKGKMIYFINEQNRGDLPTFISNWPLLFSSEEILAKLIK